VSSSKLNWPSLFLSLSQKDLSFQFNSDKLICGIDRKIVNQLHVPAFDFYDRDMCFAWMVISKTIFLSFVFGCTMNGISSFL